MMRMVTWLRRLLRAPSFEGQPDKTRAARLLNIILMGMLLADIVFVPIIILLGSYQFGLEILIGMAVTVFFALIGLLVLLRRGAVHSVGVLLLGVLFGTVTLSIYVWGGIRNTLTSAYLLVIVLAGLVLGEWAALITGLCSIGAVMWMFYLERQGELVYPLSSLEVGLFDWLSLLVVFSLMAVLLDYALRRIRESLEQARHSAEVLADTNLELQQSRDNLRNRTEELERRSQQLRTAIEITQDIAEARQIGPLLDQAVDEIRERLGFYHVGVFLLDDDNEMALLRSATGDVGQRMIKQGHRLRVGEEGLVGTVIATGKAHLASDVEMEPLHYRHPLLPETRSEVALPLKVGDRIVGALDIQSRKPEAFLEEDLDVLQAVADQLAIGLDNVRLLQDTEQAMHELEVAYGRFAEEAWHSVARRSQQAGYRYRNLEVEPVSEQSSAVANAWRRGEVVIGSDGPDSSSDNGQADGEVTTVAVPVKLRDRVLGVLNLRFRGEVTPEMVSMVEDVSERLALALENSRLLMETQSTLGEVEALYRASRLIGEASSYEDIVLGVSEVAGALGFSSCSLVHISQLDPNDRPLRGEIYAVSLVSRDVITLPQRSIDLRDYVETARLLTNPGFVRVHERLVGREADLSRAVWDAVEAEGVEGAVCAGLSSRERPLGILILGGSQSLEDFPQERIRRVRTVADQASVALESRRLFDEARQRLERERLRAEIGARVRASSEVDTILQTAVRELGRALHVSDAVIRLDVQGEGAHSSAAGERGGTESV